MEITYIGIIVLLVVYLFIVVNKLNILKARVKSMEITLNQVANHVDMPEHPVNEELRQLVKEGKEVKAVKKAREVFGFSLIEGKKYVDSLDQ